MIWRRHRYDPASRTTTVGAGSSCRHLRAISLGPLAGFRCAWELHVLDADYRHIQEPLTLASWSAVRAYANQLEAPARKLATGPAVHPLHRDPPGHGGLAA